jgi:hypothetical protein
MHRRKISIQTRNVTFFVAFYRDLKKVGELDATIAYGSRSWGEIPFGSHFCKGKWGKIWLVYFLDNL